MNDFDDYRSQEPLFGEWYLSRPLGRQGAARYFTVRSTKDGVNRRAVLKAVFLPRSREGVQALMDDLGATGDPKSFLRQVASQAVQEREILMRLNGAPNILQILDSRKGLSPDGSGMDILLLLEDCVPLSWFLQKVTPPREKRALLQRLAPDITSALKTCRDNGIGLHGLTEDNLFLTPGGVWKLGNLGDADICKAPIPREDAALQRALLEIVTRLTATVEPQPVTVSAGAGVSRRPAAESARRREQSRANTRKPPSGAIKAAVAAACALLVLVTGWFALRAARSANRASPEGSNTPRASLLPSAAPVAPTPTLSLEQARAQRISAVLATMQDICTGSQPEITDPDTWNEAGEALMLSLESDPYYQNLGFTSSAAAYRAPDEAGDGAPGAVGEKRMEMRSAVSQWQDVSGEPLAEEYPYLIAVNNAASCVTILTQDSAGRYTVPYMAMVCSGGTDTPTGFWYTPIRYQWRELVGPCYGQNATRIWSNYLFHSVPYYSQHKDDLEYDEYNLLGTKASLGCIRLAVVDVKWIFDNCPIGTPVVIYEDAENPGPMGKPGTIYTDPTDETLRGWDPTDPDPANPWDSSYRIGTAIRSEAAWQEYESAMETGQWNDTINETDLQGFSTDSTTVGTRG